LIERFGHEARLADTPFADDRDQLAAACATARAQASMTWTPPYIWLLPRPVHWHNVRVGLVVALILIVAGVVIDSLLSASWALDDGLLLRRRQSSPWRSS
jgi:hypothetical protein